MTVIQLQYNKQQLKFLYLPIANPPRLGAVKFNF